MEDERGGGASVVEAAQKLGLTPVTIDAVDRSGRLPDGQSANNIPHGLDVVSQAFTSDVGVDNDPIAVQWRVCLVRRSRHHARRANAASTRSRTRSRRKWRDDQIASRLRTKATEMVQKLDQGGKLADEAASRGIEGRDRDRIQARRLAAHVPASVIAAAFRTAKDGSGQTAGAGAGEWVVFRVTDITVPPIDFASDDIKKLKQALERGTDRRTDRRICHQARIQYRHHHQRGRLRAGDRREQLNMTNEGWPAIMKLSHPEQRPLPHRGGCDILMVREARGASSDHAALILKASDGRPQIYHRKSRHRRDTVARRGGFRL